MKETYDRTKGIYAAFNYVIANADLRNRMHKNYKDMAMFRYITTFLMGMAGGMYLASLILHIHL